jgi:hypothetical protein
MEKIYMHIANIPYLLFLLLWLQKFLVSLVLFQLGVVSSIVFVILFIFIILGLLMIANVIRVQVIPFVDGHRDEIAIAFVGNVNWNESIAELIAEIHQKGRRCHGDRWRCDVRIISHFFVVGIEDIQIVFARPRWRWQIVAVGESKIELWFIDCEITDDSIAQRTRKVEDWECHLALPRQVLALGTVVLAVRLSLMLVE